MSVEPQKKRDSLSLILMLPNMVTILGLCAGLTSIRFVLVGRYDIAAALIIFAALIDGLDGLLARRLNAASDIGGELDSLSDFLCFGVAPGILVFQFALSRDFTTGWMFVLIYVCCACLRLARFNVSRDDPAPTGKPHFVGVPAPAGAMLALLPLFLTQQGAIDARDYPEVFGIWIVIVAWLMVSKVPTISSKAIRVPREWQLVVLLAGAVVVGLMVTRFWLLLVILDLAYAAVTVVAVVRHFRARRAG
ncbi:CDP-diacylglycerol---serine O-phosphatidyltransferase [Pseudorhodobacter antarcticus]|jgi:CDP-diacylglycerol--serine O-phosphatidyltransferase|uniref:CDP-diacylglycerol--serine O-phosphatidyltransferase n=1 Tax=Pseudorhodobacter antarcticus TaxID=1077947 RepID=A0A1H8ABQ4_9RHOB|nr:CDP-diacylglycerol--serine O-phosphatidyltransferase [Pseudorhodobacter antarcticus]SEM67983.1 CDP-diacylglycerol---serine O-phosphatidyltransferase [Pseudorhodobacter antarcticus]